MFANSDFTTPICTLYYTEPFQGIKKDVWEIQIGGYQILDKWLKDRKGKCLSLKEIKKYCKIVSSLEKTLESQKKIDKIYPKVEKKIIEYYEKGTTLKDFE